MRRLLTVLLCCAVSTATGAAADEPLLQARAGTIEAGDWTLAGVASDFTLSEEGIGGEVRIARITLESSGRRFDDVRIACDVLVLTTRRASCDSAIFTATLPAIGRQSIPGAFSWDRVTGTTTARLREVAIAGGLVGVELRVDEAGLEARYAGRALDVEGLLAASGEFTDALADFSGSGQADIEGRLTAPADGPLHVLVDADLRGASLANDVGTIAAADVAGRVSVDLGVHDESTRFDLVFEATGGEAYLEPVYANFGEQALELHATDVRTPDLARFEVGHFDIRQGALLYAGGTATLVFPEAGGGPASLTAAVTLTDASVAHLYGSLVQVQLAGTVLGSLDTAGRVSGSVGITDNAPTSVVLELEDVILDDSEGRFAVYGLDGAVDWRADADNTGGPSRLTWDSGTVYGLILDGGEALLQLGGTDVELLRPLRVATLGGALRINELALHDYGSEAASGRLDAELEPVQMGQLTGALGWPAFSGKLSGRLPLLTLAGDTITVGGTLDAQLFDGTMTVSKLRIERPFGRVPRLDADLRFRHLDLQRVTDAFSFGSIQGRLNGDVTGLTLLNWRPVAMDLYVYTPEDDRSPHRISQRAVENLASVGGGGAAAALSSGFLRFFEVFAYDRIGLRCRLQDGVCAMSGVEPAGRSEYGSGYYIVKGKGVPRIDVVGYRDAVNWSRLVQQLAAITRSGAPAVN